MNSKEPVWLTSREVIDKYKVFCLDKNIDERFILKLFYANLLRGCYESRAKRIEILESSFLELLKHINYNLEKRLYRFEDDKISVPHYCQELQKPRIYQIEDNWLTATEILSIVPKLKECKGFSIEFINELVDKYILRGKYDKSNKVNVILFPSFKELMKYRNYTLEQNRIDH